MRRITWRSRGGLDALGWGAGKPSEGDGQPHGQLQVGGGNHLGLQNHSEQSQAPSSPPSDAGTGATCCPPAGPCPAPSTFRPWRSARRSPRTGPEAREDACERNGPFPPPRLHLDRPVDCDRPPPLTYLPERPPGSRRGNARLPRHGHPPLGSGWEGQTSCAFGGGGLFRADNEPP